MKSVYHRLSLTELQEIPSVPELVKVQRVRERERERFKVPLIKPFTRRSQIIQITQKKKTLSNTKQSNDSDPNTENGVILINN